MALTRFATAAAFAFTLTVPSAGQTAPSAVTVTVWSFGFAPRPIHLTAGRPVTLTFVNRSNSSHDFVARAFFANSRTLAGEAMQGMVELRGGETRTVTLIPRAGSYPVHCSHFFHKQLGMSDRIIVN